MTAKVSIKAAVRDAKRDDAKQRQTMGLATDGKIAAVKDSFVNFQHKLGLGSDNALTAGSYGFNPITRNRQLLEWIHRGSWLGGVAVDVVADDMTRNGIDFLSEMDPADQEKIEAEAQRLGIWDKLNEGIKWGRLYGGSISVMLIDGQDMKTPLKLDSIGKDQFKGVISFDRWQLEPSLEDLVTDLGPHLGLPKYYTVQANAPALRGQTIHHSRIAMRAVGIVLPYQQAMTENLWGISVLERLYDRMVAFDSASMGAAQLVFKSHLRTLSIKGLREIVSAGGKLMEGLVAYADTMRRFQGIEGMTLIDQEDEFDVQQSSAFAGVDAVITQLGQQLAGALQIPMTRLFGQAPGGMSTDDKSGMRTYYDSIQQQQRRLMCEGVISIYKLIAASLGIKLPDNFNIDFASLYTLADNEKAELAKKVTEAIDQAYDAGLITQKVAMQELRQSSRTTGVFTNISAEDIEAADEEVQPPADELGDQLALMGAQGDLDKAARDDNNNAAKEAAQQKLAGEADGNKEAKQRSADAAQRVGSRAPRRALLPD